MDYNVLVFGGNGQLGSTLKKMKYPHFFYPLRTALDLTDSEDKISAYCKANKITHILNCAAFTDVEKAELASPEALAINGRALEALVKVCHSLNVKLIHISTDYVFDGEATVPYPEDAPKNPQSAYGKSKSEGEDLIIRDAGQFIIVRTSWLYSEFGNNFVKKMLSLMKERKELKVVSDQVGNPTSCDALARILYIIIQKNISAKGVYHFSSEGSCSWYEFAREIKSYSKSSCQIFPISSADYPSSVKRPGFSVLSKEKIKRDFSIEINDWREDLNIFLTEHTELI